MRLRRVDQGRVARLRGGAREGESRGSAQEHEPPCVCALSDPPILRDTGSLALLVLGGFRKPHSVLLSSEAALNYLGWVLRYLTSSNHSPVGYCIDGKTSVFP